MKLNNKEKAVLRILRDRTDYNSNNLSKKIGLTSMGMFKILKKLESEGVLVSRKISNIRLYKINFENQFSKDFVSLTLRKEAGSGESFVKKWVSEVRKIGVAKIAIIFGSVLEKGSKAHDVDVLFVLGNGNFKKLKEKIQNLNSILTQKIHPVYQTKKDFLKNLKKKDEVLFGIIKGVVAFGEREFVDLLEVKE